MNKHPFLGTRLYNQIVYPLVAASIIVGVAAAVVAVVFQDDLAGRWVTDVARSSTNGLALQLDDYRDHMDREARLVVDQGEMREAVEAGDMEAIRYRVASGNASLGFSSMMVLDPEDSVVAVSGVPGVRIGSKPFGDVAAVPAGAARSLFTPLQGELTLTLFRPITAGVNGYTLALSQKVDDALLGELSAVDTGTFALYDDSGALMAVTSGPGTGGGQGIDKGIRAALRRGDEIKALLARADDAAAVEGSVHVGEEEFRVWVTKVSLGDARTSGSTAYIAGAVSQDVSAEAGRTTRNLITMWSVLAVIALIGLGGWVARRVSDPLVELAAGARRIADGDFSTKVHVRGSNEIAELADSFNTMTDSLKERSESLTKKVLELATLYEMSRALGSTLDMDALLASVLESALRIFDLDLGYVALRDKDAGALSIRALRRGTASGSGEAVHSSMSEWVVREGRPLIFNPDSGTGSSQIDAVTGAKAALCVPLVSSEGAIGSITIGSSDPRYRFNSDDVRLLSTIANHVTIAVGNIELFLSLQEAYLATVRSLATAVDAKDSYTRGHSDHVATYATLIAERLHLSHEQKIALEMAAYLHDIGKIGVAEEILLKPGRLSDDEMEQMRHHPLIGANILKPIAFPWAITPVVRHHHESWDGSGYPAGLRGEEIPLLARILTVADSYEAMTADRPYRMGMRVADAVAELRACSGTQFDPRVVDALIETIEELERAGEEPLGAATASDETAPEEIRAIFSALVDGVFGSFRRLGGPRLAANVESEIDSYFRAAGLPFRIVSGCVSFTQDPPLLSDGEVDMMRDALRRVDATIGRLSGATLVEHFYVDALNGLSVRMQGLARELDFVGE